MEALDTQKMETDENSPGALGAGEHGGGSHQLAPVTYLRPLKAQLKFFMHFLGVVGRGLVERRGSL